MFTRAVNFWIMVLARGACVEKNLKVKIMFLRPNVNGIRVLAFSYENMA